MKKSVRRQFQLAISFSFLLSLLFSSPISAIEVKQYEEYKRTSLSRTILKNFIDGVGYGYSWSNTFLENRGDKKLYCEPRKIVLNAENYIDIIDRQIAVLKKSNLPLQSIMETPVELLLYIGLVDSFPCSR
ncbi:MAG: hypothetical protein M1G31_11085 [Pseudanabaena sp. Salubria-1]|nr:hypothetical protein [Pseudanabaena sp. Salubria-1]